MNKRNIAPILAGLLIAIGAGVVIAHAQEYTYTPLAPLPLGTGGSTPATYTISTYIAGMIKLLIALGAATAILFAVIGGTQYVAASINPGAKKDAMERIQNALIGLAIMLTSYLLLVSINPELVNFKLELKGVNATSTPIADLSKWPDDTVIREELKSADVFINKDNCKKIGDTVCTSVAGLPRKAINGIIALKKDCKSIWNDGCPTTITGGTEQGHKTHGIDIANVDLDDRPTLSSFIRDHGGLVANSGCGVSSAKHYAVLNKSYSGVYVYEKNKSGTGYHWHVCFK